MGRVIRYGGVSEMKFRLNYIVKSKGRLSI